LESEHVLRAVMADHRFKVEESSGQLTLNWA
jgi:hypothetical protein